MWNEQHIDNWYACILFIMYKKNGENESNIYSDAALLNDLAQYSKMKKQFEFSSVFPACLSTYTFEEWKPQWRFIHCILSMNEVPSKSMVHRHKTFLTVFN